MKIIDITGCKLNMTRDNNIIQYNALHSVHIIYTPAECLYFFNFLFLNYFIYLFIFLFLFIYLYYFFN